MTAVMERISIEDEAIEALDSVVRFFDRCCQAVATEDTLTDLQAEAWQISEDHGFHDVGQTVGEKLMLIVSEASEALEDHRDGREASEVWYVSKDNPGDEPTPPKPCGIPSELADIVIRCLDMAECYGIDLATIIREKMDYNRTRPHLHGRTM